MARTVDGVTTGYLLDGSTGLTTGPAAGLTQVLVEDHHPKQFNTWWREDQYWYYLNGHGPDPQMGAYVDWRETTETPDFVAVGLDVEFLLVVGTGPARIIDR